MINIVVVSPVNKLISQSLYLSASTFSPPKAATVRIAASDSSAMAPAAANTFISLVTSERCT